MSDSALEQAIQWQIRLQQSPRNPLLKWRWRQWLQQQSAHQQAWNQVENLWDLSLQLGPSAPVAKPRSHRRVSQAIAACALLVLLGTWQWLSPSLNQPQLSADGSHIWPRPGSHYSLHINDRERRVLLKQGAAYFDVKPNRRPFIVEAGAVQVRVLGTAFSVERDADLVTVSVERGQVQVNQQILLPGQQLRLNSQVPQPAAIEAAQTPVAPWRDDLLLARHTALGSLSEQLDALYPGVIVFDDAQLRSKPITGRFDLSQPEQSLRAMLRPYGAEVRHYWPGVLRVIPAEKSSK